MNFRILQVPYKTKEKQEVLLHRDMDENCEMSDVKIKAFIRPDELWHEELIQYENEIHQRFLSRSCSRIC
jgi:hypothetical protein